MHLAFFLFIFWGMYVSFLKTKTPGPIFLFLFLQNNKIEIKIPGLFLPFLPSPPPRPLSPFWPIRSDFPRSLWASEHLWVLPWPMEVSTQPGAFQMLFPALLPLGDGWLSLGESVGSHQDSATTSNLESVVGQARQARKFNPLSIHVDFFQRRPEPCNWKL